MAALIAKRRQSKAERAGRTAELERRQNDAVSVNNAGIRKDKVVR